MADDRKNLEATKTYIRENDTIYEFRKGLYL
jgi:hypothetical protein